MKLNLQTFATIVANSAAAVQAGATQLLDLSAGSVLRAILEANASIALWMQWLLVCVLRATRASSSSDADLDTWMADFAFTRLAPSRSVGTITFSRYSSTVSALIMAGTLVKTSDGTQTFSVSADTSNAAWSNPAGGYVLASGVASIDVPVIALVAGLSGNVQAGTLTMIASPIVGVDVVDNALGTYAGSDAESDSAFRQRFLLYINSRSQATLTAVECAIAGVQQGLSYSIRENSDPNGAFRNGSFLVTVDDGSGNPSSSLLGAVSTAVECIRPIGSAFAVRAPTVLNVSISANITLSSNVNRQAGFAAIAQNLTSFVNNLPIGAELPLSRIAQLAYDAVPGVINVSNIEINGTTNDVVSDTLSVIKLASLSIT